MALLRWRCSRNIVAEGGPVEARRERGREGGRAGEGGGSAGPLRVREMRRGREEVAVAVGVSGCFGVDVLGAGAGMRGVVGVGGLDLGGLEGEGAGAARGTVVVVVVEMVRGEGAWPALRFLDGFSFGEGTGSGWAGGGSGLGVSSRLRFCEGVLAGSFATSFGLLFFFFGLSC